MTDDGVKRPHMWLRALLGLLVLAAVAAVAASFVMKSRPGPAPTDGNPAMGTISAPDAKGMLTYDSTKLRFRFRYPQEWSLRESASASGTEGDYLTLTMAPRTSSGTLSPPKLEVVPDPQGFTAEAVARMKWGTAPATVTVTTETLSVDGGSGIEVRVNEPGKDKKALQTYEAATVISERLFLLRFSTQDRAEFERYAAICHDIARTLSGY
jgi:hypothetical protein